MLRWLRAGLAAALWGFLLIGLVGAAEGLSQWLRFDVSAHQQPSASLFKLLVSPLVLYGWFGLLIAGLAFVPAGFLARWRPKPRRRALALAVAAAVASLGVVYANYVLRTHLLPNWWEQSGGSWGRILLGLIWMAGLLVAYRVLSRFSEWLARRGGPTLIYPVLVVIVATSLWPDWREEGRIRRTAHLTRAAAPAAAEAGAPPLILISIDTLRPDYLSHASPSAPPTPGLDALAAEGVRFTRAWSVSPWTLPSMSTVMTGLPPRVLGVEKYRPLSGAMPRLAEIAWEQGYRTAAFATNAFLTNWYGFDRGFEFFEHSLVFETILPAGRSVLARELSRYADRNLEADSAEIVIPKTIGWLWQRGGDGPFFLWVHLMNPHLPYRWRDQPAASRVLSGQPGQEPDEAAIPDRIPFKKKMYWGVHRIRDGDFIPDAGEREALRTLYAREVQFTDYWLDKLIAELKRLDLWDRSLVVLMSDHGEELFDHGGFEHGHSVLPEVARVALLMRLPGGEAAGSLVEAPVSTLDLLPTICHLLDWPVPEGAPGHTLWPRAAVDSGMAGGSGQVGPPLIVENLLYEPQQQGVLAWPWYCVIDAEASEPVWYNLASDPTAGRPQSGPLQGGDILAGADSLLADWDRQAAALRLALEDSLVPPLPSAIKRELEALGY